MNEGTLKNEEAAEHRTNISGWVCKTCRRFYGDGQGSEGAARYCCEKDHRCGTDGCEGRAAKPYIYCDPCVARRDEARWLALQEVEWDGEEPLCVFDDDRYFFDADSLADWLEEEGIPVEKVRLVLCEEDDKPLFCMDDFISDYMGEHGDPGPTKRVDDIVNRWIGKNVPQMWVAGNRRPTLASLVAATRPPGKYESEA
jgi:hypothetical protein